MDGKLRSRLARWVLIVSTVLFSWWGMMAVHEFGHVLGAWITGGRVERVVLHPLAISRTDLAYNPRPALVAWAGPVGGSLLPLALLVACHRLRLGGTFVVRFFAGFCLVANGAYLGCGSFGHVGDAGDLLRLGQPRWLLWAFGAVTIPVGLALWHGQGRHFGLRDGEVNPRVAVMTTAAVFLLLVVQILYFADR